MLRKLGPKLSLTCAIQALLCTGLLPTVLEWGEGGTQGESRERIMCRVHCCEKALSSSCCLASEETSQACVARLITSW